jgi:hypothetical protein
LRCNFKFNLPPCVVNVVHDDSKFNQVCGQINPERSESAAQYSDTTVPCVGKIQTLPNRSTSYYTAIQTWQWISSTSKMVAPVVLIGLLLAKKAAVGTLYMFGKSYGWPRAYRRLLEINRKNTPLAQQKLVRSLIRTSFVVPAKALEAVQNNFVYQMAEKEVMRRYSNTPTGAILLKFMDKVTKSAEPYVKELEKLVSKDRGQTLR